MDKIYKNIALSLFLFVLTIGLTLAISSYFQFNCIQEQSEFKKYIKVKQNQLPVLVKNLDMFEKRGFEVKGMTFNKHGDALVEVEWIGQLDHYIGAILRDLYP